MAIPQSAPVIPAAPDQDSYGPADLALFKTYTRDTYRAVFGVEAPGYDPSRLIKTWFDSTVDTSYPGNVSLYKILTDMSGPRQMVIPAREAATVNLPGAIPFPAYVIPPTQAMRGGGLLWAEQLSLEADARALLAELGIQADLFDPNDYLKGTAFPVLYGNEPRREWNFVYQGATYNVGILREAKLAQGIGAPGHWSISGNIQWMPDPPAPTGLDDTRPPRPVPVRDLLPDEIIGTDMMGVGPVITRASRRQAQQEASGQFTSADRAMLRDISSMMTKIAAQLAPK